jgi:septal ring factor EnvC (AmiA/AmiB activator)
MKDKNKRYIYVPTELADKIEQADDIAVMSAAVDEYLKDSVKDIGEMLGVLDEEVQVYKGLMAKARVEFRKASQEQIEQSYATWEEVDKQRPRVQAKVKELVNDLKPLTDELNEINNLLNSMDLSRVERTLKLLNELQYAPDETKKMLVFLVANYKI